MNPDVYITIAFGLLAVLFGFAGTVLAAYEYRLEATSSAERITPKR